jgi:putative Holliday junction resolvase
MNGSLGPQGEKTKQFAEKLEKKLKHSTRITEPVEIVYWDERLTTLGANRMLIETDMRREKRKKVVDTVAAVLILQGYLDGNREA